MIIRDGTAGYEFFFQLKNSGITPAHKVFAATGAGRAPKNGLNAKATPPCQFIANDSQADFGPGAEPGVEAVYIETEDFINAEADGTAITFAVHVR